MSPCDPSSEGLADFLEARSEDITRRWEERVGKVPSPSAEGSEAFLATLPEFLTAMVAALRGRPTPGSTQWVSVDTIAETHGAQCFRRGLDISEVVREYSVLRSIILEILDESSYPLTPEVLRILVDAIAAAAAEALRCYAVEYSHALSASRAKLQEIIDHAPAVISAKDTEGRYLFVNRAFEELSGTRREAIVGRTDYDCFSRETADTFRATDAQVLATGQPLEVEEEVPQGDGAHVWRSLKFPLPRAGARPYATCCISTDITLSRRMQRERDEARERLSRVLAALPIIFFSFEAQGGLTLVEGRILERLGLEQGEVIGQSIFKNSLDYPALTAAIERALQGESVSEELEYQGRWFDAVFLPDRGPDGAVRAVSGMAVDITERRRAEEELRQSETRYRLVTLATHDAVWDWNLDTNQVQWGENLQRLTGYEATGVVSAIEWWSEHIHPEDRERVLGGVQAVLEGGGNHWAEEYRFRHVDGSYMLVAERGYVVRDEQGRAVRMVGALQDITERRRAEQETRRRADFEQHLIGIVSHDLRNPLNAISMSAALLLKQGGLDEARSRALQRIVSSAARATRMLRDLLDFTQARLRGALPVKLRPLDLHELTRQVVEEVQLAWPRRQLILEQSGDGRGAWDADRLAQLITNLVNNALAYGSEHCAVRVRTDGLPDEVQLSVHNTGEPIPAQLMGQLFEPLKRGSVPGSADNHSIGLGLFIVKHIVDAHGGSISVDSTREHGTTFTVSLPRHSTQAPEPPHAQAPQPLHS
ncbi:PAS domain S-box protein [Hyalangium sp.]|uniref:PAS domain S-box protein n=1 Tax=Hyalangium sp. TaxID=2028555 RepID=UPI002D698F09|nr:PAS domain S-box protein [Hyalangium sp.]HYH99156.1 PAS domain S-box protein [Hyalangium sp.]